MSAISNQTGWVDTVGGSQSQIDQHYVMFIGKLNPETAHSALLKGFQGD